MGLLNRIRRHAAVAQGNFAEMFRDVELAPLPEAVSRILEEIHKPEPDAGVLEQLISAEPELSVRILATVNSSLHALRSKVTSVRHAVTMLGLDRVRSVVMASAMIESLPSPPGGLFDHRVYWTDTLLRSLMARELAAVWRPGEEELAFTAMLLADVAVPVLLDSWAEYYGPVIEEWQKRPIRLARLEKDVYGWEHGQASSWILRYWGFPDELVTLVAAHNKPPDVLRDIGLLETVAPAMVTAGLLPSCRNPDLRRCVGAVDLAEESLGIDPEQWPAIMESVQGQFIAIHAQFGLQRMRADRIFELLKRVFENDRQQLCM